MDALILIALAAYAMVAASIIVLVRVWWPDQADTKGALSRVSWRSPAQRREKLVGGIKYGLAELNTRRRWWLAVIATPRSVCLNETNRGTKVYASVDILPDQTLQIFSHYGDSGIRHYFPGTDDGVRMFLEDVDYQLRRRSMAVA